MLALPALARAESPEPWEAPQRAARKENPLPADAASITRGNALYIKNCLSCHGPAGRGDGPAVKDLDTDPGNITSKQTRGESDGALFWKITEGRKPMPAFEKSLSNEGRWDVVNYMRSLASGLPPASHPAAAPAQAEKQVPQATSAAAPGDKYVTREEYEKVLQELADIKARLQYAPNPGSATNVPVAAADTAALQATVQTLEKKQETQQADNDQALDALEKKFKDLKSQTKPGIPGTDHMLLSGYGASTFQAARSGYAPSQSPADTPAPGDPRPARSSFTADFDPIFLWQLNDKVFFEGELAVGLGSGGATNLELEYAQVSYLANDFMTFGAGKFLNPINYYVEQLHPEWINKLPNRPLAVFDGLLPEGIVGAQIHGGVPVGPTKFKYAFFVGNAPSLDTQALGDSHAGLLNLGDNQFAFSHITVGGHVGFFPIPELELGYGIQGAKVGPTGSGASALWRSVDLNYMRDSKLLEGVIDLRAQWVWSNIDAYTVDPTTGLTPLPAGQSNDRNGGYVQFAYRPTKVDNKVIKNLEGVIRYDMLNQRNTPIGFDERRWSLGLDYWLTGSSVLKAAYERDLQNGTGQNGDDFLLQYVIGF